VDSKARNSVLAEAQTWLGTKWHHQARIKGVGVDCAMYLCEVYEAVGLTPHIDPRPYPADWHFHRDDERFLDWLKQYARPVKTPLAGDIAVFKFGRTFSHGAIVKEWPLVIHCYIHETVREQDATQGYLADRDVMFWRIKKIKAL
jgi:cell wall-associated NlpC family hydrolase